MRLVTRSERCTLRTPREVSGARASGDSANEGEERSVAETLSEGGRTVVVEDLVAEHERSHGQAVL